MHSTPRTGPFPRRVIAFYLSAAAVADRLQSIFALAVRLYLARVFLVSGLIKLQHWAATLALFESEYHVPLLAPHVAAVVGTLAELVLPVLVLSGFGTRFAALALFVFNIVAATSYPDLSPAGLEDHILWGALLVMLFVYGPGKIALDHWLARRYTPGKGQ